VTDIGISRVTDECHALESLCLTSCKDVTDISILCIAQGCPNLKILMILMCGMVLAAPFNNPTSINITDLSIIDIAEKCPLLEAVDFGYCTNMTDASMIIIANMCPKIRSIKLAECRNISDAAIMKTAEKCKNLETLFLV
jgi:F-box/leucine-rich repeat protein 2/20